MSQQDCGHALQQIREDFVATDPGANHTPDTRQEKGEEYAQQLVSPPHAGGANVLGNLLQFTHGRRSQVSLHKRRDIARTNNRREAGQRGGNKGGSFDNPQSF